MGISPLLFFYKPLPTKATDLKNGMGVSNALGACTNVIFFYNADQLEELIFEMLKVKHLKNAQIHHITCLWSALILPVKGHTFVLLPTLYCKAVHKIHYITIQFKSPNKLHSLSSMMPGITCCVEQCSLNHHVMDGCHF